MKNLSIIFLKFVNDNFLILLAVMLIFYIIVSASLYFICEKIGFNKKKALIPIYNIVLILKIVNLPKWLILIFIIPYVNFIGIFVLCLLIGWRFGKVLKQSLIMRIGLIILPFIFFPILAHHKNLIYNAYPPSAKLISEKKVVVEEKEVVIDIPKYDVEEVDDLTAISLSDYDSSSISKFDKEQKSDEVKTTKKKKSYDDDITYDYDDLYNDHKENLEAGEDSTLDESKDSKDSDSVESELEMNQEQYNDINMINNSNVSQNQITDNGMITPAEPMAQAPIDSTMVTPAMPIDGIVQPTNGSLNDNPSTVVNNAINDEQLQTAMPEIPVVQAPIMNTTNNEVSGVAQSSAPEVPVTQPPIVDTAPTNNEINNVVQPSTPEVPVAQSPIVDTPPTNNEVSNVVQPNTPEVPVAQSPIVETTPTSNEVSNVVQPSAPEVLVAQPPVADTAPTNSSVEQPSLPEIPVEQATEEVKEADKMPPSDANVPNSEDEFTFDYNKVYNIPGAETNEEVVEENVENNPQMANNESILDSAESFDTLQMAAPPSFEVKEEVKPEVEVKNPVIPEVNKDDLVSIRIEEPDSLPVGNLEQKNVINNPNIDFNKLMAPSATVSAMNMPVQQPIEQQPIPEIVPVPDKMPTILGQSKPTIVNNPSPTVSAATKINPFSGPGVQQTPINQPQIINQPPLLRNNEDTRAALNASHGPIGSKFIDNEDNKYTLPREEPAQVQMPTDPNLMANPMAIFGSSSTLRPTSEEALRNEQASSNSNTYNNTKNSSTNKAQGGICPNCGFVVKEGQPMCVVCGYKFN